MSKLSIPVFFFNIHNHLAKLRLLHVSNIILEVGIMPLMWPEGLASVNTAEEILVFLKISEIFYLC